MEKIKFEIDLKRYPKNALYATAYCFLDEVYISLEIESVTKKGNVATVIFEKNGDNEESLKDLKKKFLKELSYSTIRNGLSKKNKKIREAIVAQALFSAIGGFENVDDHKNVEIAGKKVGGKNIESDPLGISLAWGDKYANN